MGTWAAGPFGNDRGLDYVSNTTDSYVDTILAFIDAPQLEDNFDKAFAAIALLNVLAEKVNASLPSAAEVDVWKRIFLHTYDSQIDALHPDGAYKRAHRQAIEKEFASSSRPAANRREARRGCPWVGWGGCSGEPRAGARTSDARSATGGSPAGRWTFAMTWSAPGTPVPAGKSSSASRRRSAYPRRC